MGNVGVGGHILATASVDPPSINAASTTNVVVTVESARIGMKVLAVPPNLFDNGLVCIAAEVTAHKQVTVRISNVTAGAIHGATLTWTFVLFAGEGSVAQGVG